MKSINKIKLNIKKNKIKVGIVGLGYVGLPLAKGFVEKGVKTFGFDIDGSKIKKLKNGISYINYFSNNDIKTMKKKNL